jgi:hypothetical protein
MPWTVRTVRSAGGALVALGLVASTPAAGAATAPLLATYSLQALAVPTQTVFGPSATVAVLFPPPPAPLDGTGGLLELVLAHGPLAPGSSLSVWVGQQSLAVLPLQGTDTGGPIALPIPAAALGSGPNLLTLGFRMLAQGSGPAEASVGDQSFLQYRLAWQGLATYPFPLLQPAPASTDQISLLLPGRPDRAEVTALLLLADDLGRRGTGQVSPDVITQDQMAWLETGGSPGVLVGGWSTLPGAAQILEAAGFRPSGNGWLAPTGRPVGDQGVLAEVTSPWDHQSPVVLVTGATDQAVIGAAVALASGVAQLTGSYSLVPAQAGPIASTLGPDPGATVALPLPRGGVELGGNSTALTVPVQVPPVEPQADGLLELHADAPPRSRLQLMVDGRSAGAAQLPASGTVRLAIPGSLLEAGQDALTLSVSMPAGPVPSRFRLLSARLRLPGQPAETDLGELPHPLFDDPAGLAVLLGDHSQATLTAAARAMAALGARSPILPTLAVVYPEEVTPAVLADHSLLAVGSQEQVRTLTALGLQPADDDGGGTVEEVTMPGGHALLWVGGGDPRAVLMASQALAGQLAGDAVSVSGAGQVSPLNLPLPQPPALAAIKALAALAALLMVAGVCWQVWRPRSETG